MLNLFKLPSNWGSPRHQGNLPETDIALNIVRNYLQQNGNLDEKKLTENTQEVLTELENLQDRLEAPSVLNPYEIILASLRRIDDHLKK